MSRLDPGARARRDLSRRGFLQVGYSGLLGLGLPGLLAGRAAASAGQSAGRAKSVIVILLSGGLGQHDSFDMKPEAPDGIRGEFKPIATAVPGHPDLRAPARPGGAGRSAGDRPLDVASRGEPPGRRPPRADGPPVQPARGERPRSGRLARRLPLLRGRARPRPPPERRHPQRRGLADAAGRGPAHLAGPGRRLPRPAARPLAAPARPEPARVPRRQPGAARRARPDAAASPPAPARPGGRRRRRATPSSTSRTPRSPCSATARSAGRSTSTARTRGSSTATAATSSAGRS